MQWHLEWSRNAIYEDGTGRPFRDSDFHDYLRKQGIKQQSESRNEWFQISPEESLRLFNDFRVNGGVCKTKSVSPYSLRNEQNEAVERAIDYFKLNVEGEFLWNAKPRFGKTLSVYDLCKRMGLSNVLIVTNRPAIANSWYDDFCKFIGDDSGYRFVSEVDALKNRPHALTEDQFQDLLAGQQDLKLIEFLSLQDLKGSIYFGGKYDKLKSVRDREWDILVIDEAHEGVDTFKTDVAFDHIRRKHTLHLSGTPFKAIANDKFPENAIYNWTYVDEQKAKNAWIEIPGTQNPYERLPTLCMFTYQMSEIVRRKVEQGVDIDGDPEEYAFDLNEFFKTKGNGNDRRFVYDDAVNVFLDTLATNEKYPFSTEELRNELRHTLWLLNRVDSAKALATKLKEHPIFRRYEIVLAAGDGELDDVKETEKAFDRVRKAIDNHDRTITISVGQLTTGVTVPEWSAVLMLSNISSPALYMQAAFRAQNPYSFRVGKEYRRKETAYVFDFDPARTLEIFEKFANDLSSSTVSGKGEMDARRNNVRELLNFFPVIGEDESGRMIELDAEKVLSIPRTLRSKEVVRSGFMSNYLFQNISNVFGAPDSVINIIKSFDETKDQGSLTQGKALYVDDEGNVQLPEDKVIGTATELFGEKIYYDPGQYDSIIDEAQGKLDPPKEEYAIKRLVEQFSEDVAKPMLDTAKDKFGKDLSKSTQKNLERKIKTDAEITIKKAVADHQIIQNTLESEMNEAIDKTSTIQERNEIVREYEDKKKAATEEFKKTLDGKIDELVKSAGMDIARQVQTDQVKKDIHDVEEKVRNHLRGFTRTIPAFLMAYGEGREVTLANFDEIIPGDVFKEVTSITPQEFRLLRDGGSILNDDGVKEFYEGHLFDEVVFNDSVREFMSLKRKLANYFDETSEEDIFDDGVTLYDESISPSTMGMVVDYLTRLDQGSPSSEAFQISLKGAILSNRQKEAEAYLSGIKGLDDDSILNACRLVWFDQVYRTGTRGFGDPTDAVPDHETCENIRTMVRRASEFFKKYGPVVQDCPVFPGGYTETITAGDGDFTTEDTLWDFKVSKNEPTINNTLQVAIYFIMAHHSTIQAYQNLTKIGLFNPRLNVAYLLDMSKVPDSIIREIESEVIRYRGKRPRD